MTGKQNTVMWLGILLIVVRLFSTGQWQALWNSVVPATPTGGTGKGGIGGCPKGQIMVDGKCLKEEAADITPSKTATGTFPTATYPTTAIPT